MTAKLSVLPGLYRHYRGAYYRVLFTARVSTNGPGEGKEVVVYISDAGFHVRGVEEFTGFVPMTTAEGVEYVDARFAWVSP